MYQISIILIYKIVKIKFISLLLIFINICIIMLYTKTVLFLTVGKPTFVEYCINTRILELFINTLHIDKKKQLFLNYNVTH